MARVYGAPSSLSSAAWALYAIFYGHGEATHDKPLSRLYREAVAAVFEAMTQNGTERNYARCRIHSRRRDTAAAAL
jgi:hypothetical protein